MEFPNEHNSQRNDKRAERANASQPDNQPAVRSLPCGLLRCFHSGFLCGFARSLFLGLTLEFGLSGFLGFFFCGGLLLGGKPLFFCLLGLRLLFGETGFFGFLFRLLALSLYLLVEIGFQQHCQLSAYNRACALSVSIRHVHIAARPVGQSARVHGQQKRPLGPDDADVVFCSAPS